jgi:hypothetical protein
MFSGNFDNAVAVETNVAATNNLCHAWTVSSYTTEFFLGHLDMAPVKFELFLFFQLFQYSRLM